MVLVVAGLPTIRIYTSIRWGEATELLQQPANLLIDIGDAGVVGAVDILLLPEQNPLTESRFGDQRLELGKLWISCGLFRLATR